MQLDLFGNALTNNGTLDALDATVVLNRDELVALAGTGDLDLGSLQVDDLTGAQVTADTLKVRSELILNAGDFDANGKEVVLVSDAAGTARLAPVNAAASYTGFLRQQRYIPAGVTNWRLLSSPVSPLQLYQWREDFYTAGFPGSHWPTFDQPVGSNILWPSIRTYDETNTGTALTDGLVGPTDISDQIQVGRGYAAWCGDNLFTTTAFIIDVFKNPTIANTPVSLPMSWTDTGTPLVDGWNLVGNPLASPIDLDALVLGADVDGTFWVFDPVSGNNYFRDTDLDVGSGPMATSSTIQSSQGFWAKANGAANSVTVDESAKTLDPNGGSPFGGMQLQNTPLLRLGLHSQLNQFSDEALLHFGVGGPGADAIDIVKFTFSHPEAPQLWSASQDGDVLALNAWGTVPGTAAIPVHVNTAVTGDHTLEVMQLTQPMEGYCLVLEDLETGTLTEVVLGATYTFTLDASAPADPARFLLHVSQLPEGTLTASATEVLVGEAVTFGSGTQPGALVTWDFGDGTTSTEEAPVHAYTLPGSYPVTLTVGSAPCDLVLTEVIEVGISTGLE
ncbi:MAG: PKD domain-containing protein, partial [Flavobacteriales bacterium]|nr:PKD domain-containing protein [Flavobacteriales bacterium]